MSLPAFTRAPGAPPFLIAGPCVVESEALCLAIATQLRAMGEDLGLPVIFKATWATTFSTTPNATSR